MIQFTSLTTDVGTIPQKSDLVKPYLLDLVDITTSEQMRRTGSSHSHVKSTLNGKIHRTENRFGKKLSNDSIRHCVDGLENLLIHKSYIYIYYYIYVYVYDIYTALV